MHTQRFLLGVAVLALVSSRAIASPSGEIPLTTPSAEAKALYLKARDMAENLELAGAIRQCNVAVEKDPSFAMAYVLRGTASGGNNFRDDVSKAAGMIDQVSPGEKLWILAEKAVADGKPAEARQPLEALVRMFPADKHVRLRFAGYSMMVTREMPQAVTQLDKAVAIDPAFAPAFNLLGYAHSDMGNFVQAEKAFRRYMALQPNRPNPYDSYAELLMKTGRYDESIRQYHLALAKDASFNSSLAGVGTNLVLKKDFEAARQAFEQQRDKAPDLDGQLDAIENIAKSYVAEGKVERAVEEYGRANEQAMAGRLPARGAGACFDAAFVLTEHGKLDEARKWVDRGERAVSDAAQLPAAVRERYQRGARLARIRIDTAAGEFDRARAEIDTVRPAIEQARVPGEMRALNEALGSLALRQQRYADAERYLAQADDRSPYALYERAKAMAGAGQSAQAAALFRKVADWNANDLGYALVGEQAKEQAATAPVATAGRTKK